MRKKVPDKKSHTYFRTLVHEVLTNLGDEIHQFRNMKTNLTNNKLLEDIPPDLLFLVDALYQTALDNILDGLTNAKDLHVGTTALDGIEKSMLVRRGFKKLNEVI